MMIKCSLFSSLEQTRLHNNAVTVTGFLHLQAVNLPLLCVKAGGWRCRESLQPADFRRKAGLLVCSEIMRALLEAVLRGQIWKRPIRERSCISGLQLPTQASFWHVSLLSSRVTHEWEEDDPPSSVWESPLFFRGIQDVAADSAKAEASPEDEAAEDEVTFDPLKRFSFHDQSVDSNPQPQKSHRLYCWAIQPKM